MHRAGAGLGWWERETLNGGEDEERGWEREELGRKNVGDEEQGGGRCGQRGDDEQRQQRQRRRGHRHGESGGRRGERQGRGRRFREALGRSLECSGGEVKLG